MQTTRSTIKGISLAKECEISIFHDYHNLVILNARVTRSRDHFYHASEYHVKVDLCGSATQLHVTFK